MCTKRLSQGHFTWWPTAQDASARLSARELAIVLWNGNPQQAGMADEWKSWPKAGRGWRDNSTAAMLTVTKDRGAVLLQRHQIVQDVHHGLETGRNQTGEQIGDVGTVLNGGKINCFSAAA